MKKTILSFIKDSSYVIIGAGLSLLCNYFFHFYVSRALGPKDYGVYNALLSFSLLLTLPFGAISLAVANEAVRLEKEKIPDYIRQLLFFDITFAAFLFVLLFINIKWISAFLHIDNLLLILTTFFIPVIFLFPFILNGILQGLQLFKPYALVTTSVQLFRLIFGVTLVILGLKVLGALLGSILGSIAGLMLLLFFIRDYLSWPAFKRRDERIKQTIKKSLSYLGYTGAFFSIMYVDVPLVKHFFTAQETG
ncbi:MAG: oligosaccharide flippase family protein, partial [Candidatus Desulfofervidus sp.]|nr:oligosaccharide flippase family protein [Candidatus Desulfofervidus sp.]